MLGHNFEDYTTKLRLLLETHFMNEPGGANFTSRKKEIKP
jgi:hypothetical protein